MDYALNVNEVNFLQIIDDTELENIDGGGWISDVSSVMSMVTSALALVPTPYTPVLAAESIAFQALAFAASKKGL